MKKILLLSCMMCLFASAVMAQASYDIKEMTPAVKSALESRKARFGELKSLKAQGLVGENNRGYVQLLGGPAQNKSVVDAENRDRKLIYQTIVEQNGLAADSLATVEKVFAKVQANKADHGEKVQDEAGQWR